MLREIVKLIILKRGRAIRDVSIRCFIFVDEETEAQSVWIYGLHKVTKPD